MNENEIKGIVEALLITSSEPLTLDQLQTVFDGVGKETAEPFPLQSPRYLSPPLPSEEVRKRDEEELLKKPADEDSFIKPTLAQLQLALAQLAKDYENRAIELKELANGYVLQTRQYFSPWISRLYSEKPPKYSRALLETLAIIAYRQPVTRADIEEIRGVAVASSLFKTLLEREWIRIAGHRDVPGKPSVYTTTKAFLSYFNLKSLSELPSLSLTENPNSSKV